jgi:hypothetical protein
MKAIRSSESSVLTTSTRRHVSEGVIVHRLRLFENRMLRRIFGQKGDELTGGWRKLHNEDLHSLYSTPSIIRINKSRRMWWTGHVARIGNNRTARNLLVGKSEGTRPLGRSTHRWVDNTEIDLEIG